MEKLNDTLLYTLDKCFRTYNQFAQRNVRKAGFDITIDQWLILKSLTEDPSLTQADIGKIVFKDGASITRTIQLLVKAGYLNRKSDATDKRRMTLTLTETGRNITAAVNEIAIKNRSTALSNLSEAQISGMKDLLQQIIKNCNL